MLSKLEPEAFLGVRHALQVGQRHLELAIASRADCDRRNCPKPFQHSEIAFRHANTVSCAGTNYRVVSSISEIQSGRFNTSRGLGPSAAPTIPSCSIRSIRWAARP